jgi:membrane carboxypeptidase/penicillin-binding protein
MMMPGTTKGRIHLEGGWLSLVRGGTMTRRLARNVILTPEKAIGRKLLEPCGALGLSANRAALPIWTGFMTRALTGDPDVPFDAPDNLSCVDSDRDTGVVAGPGCPGAITAAFLVGAVPTEGCARHRDEKH